MNKGELIYPKSIEASTSTSTAGARLSPVNLFEFKFIIGSLMLAKKQPTS